ncbi:hypothetical protein [Zobellella taiwanensis]|nr:hypothetical protein [Zobellella taiwanensis]
MNCTGDTFTDTLSRRPDTLPDAGIDTLAQALANGEQQWQQGI